MMKLCGDNKVQREPKMKLKDWKIRCPQGEYGAELRTGEKMQRRRLRSGRLNVARFSLTCALVVITLTAIATVHFLSSPSVVTLPNIHGLRKQGETGTKEWRGEMRWMQEFSPRHMSKLEGVIGSPQLEKLWKQPHNGGYVQCVEPSSMYSNPDNSRGYLLVHANGGLNQMRAGICDMVAVARIINATLVIPELDKGSFWQDLSNFSDVFKEAHFITSLANDVRIIKKLPKELRKAKKKAKDFRSWSGLSYYQNEMSRLWNVYEVIRAAKSDSRLANNGLPSDIQKLRCRCLYGALQFAPRIEALGKLLVERMKSYGPYVALHLRYEKDILAFSGCSHGLSSDDEDELTRIRMDTIHWKVKDIDPIEQRAKGDCPLSPKEVGLFLSSLGYPPSTPIYIAAGTIYGGETHMGDLQARFPLLMNKEKLASSEELMPFKKYASQLAALDYIVSVESDVFLPSYSGNMARAVEGHRRFLGHRTTISPDRKTLVRLFDKLWRGEIEDETKLSKAVVNAHKRRRGSPRKRRGPKSGSRGKDRFRSEETFYENPLPDCLCKKGTADRGKLL